MKILNKNFQGKIIMAVTVKQTRKQHLLSSRAQRFTGEGKPNFHHKS